ncbi:unnamed protein product [Rotaria sp. Silwood1]|nr:unnamed protein product [Rotaria sp. Silwood1]
MYIQNVLGWQISNQAIGTSTTSVLYVLWHLDTCDNRTEQSCAERNILSKAYSDQYLRSGYHGGLLGPTTQTDALGFDINKDDENSDHGSFHILAVKITLIAIIQRLELL